MWDAHASIQYQCCQIQIMKAQMKHFTIFEPQNMSIGKFDTTSKRRSADFWDSEFGKGSVGHRKHRDDIEIMG